METTIIGIDDLGDGSFAVQARSSDEQWAHHSVYVGRAYGIYAARDILGCVAEILPKCGFDVETPDQDTVVVPTVVGIVRPFLVAASRLFHLGTELGLAIARHNAETQSSETAEKAKKATRRCWYQASY